MKEFAERPPTCPSESENQKSTIFPKDFFPQKSSLDTWNAKLSKLMKIFGKTKKKIGSNSKRLEIFFLFRLRFFLNDFDWTHRKLFDNPAQKSFSNSWENLAYKKVGCSMFFFETCHLHVFLCSSGMQFWLPCWKIFAKTPQFFSQNAETIAKLYIEENFFLKLVSSSCSMQDCQQWGNVFATTEKFNLKSKR